MDELGYFIRCLVAAAIRESVTICTADGTHHDRWWVSRGVQRWKRQKVARALERRRSRR